MNEEITKESLELTQNDNDSDSVSDTVYGNSDTVTTSTDSTDATDTDSETDNTSQNVWTSDSDILGNSVSGGDILPYAETDTEILFEIQENTSEILKDVSASTSLLVLIFMFLLFEWTEKKLKVTVNRFTDKRRH